MRKIKFNFIALAASGLVITAVPAMVYAQHGSDDSSTTTTISNTSGSGGSGSSSTGGASDTSGSTPNTGSTSRHDADPAGGTEVKTASDAQEQENEQNDTNKNEADGRDFIAELLKTKSKHSDQDRAKNCQAAEKGLETKLANLQKNAASFKSKVDAVYSQALAYQTANNLNPAGIAQLEATASADQTAAKASVGALSGLSVNLDCSSNTVAQNVATFRAAAAHARTDLIAYKNAVVAVLTALEGA